MSETTSAVPESFGLWKIILGFFRRVSKNPLDRWSQTAQNVNSKGSYKTNDRGSGSSHSAASGSPPTVFSSRSETVPDSPSQESQSSSSRKSSADDSRQFVPTSSARNHKNLRINPKKRGSIVYFPPIYDPETAFNSHSPSPVITTPNSPDEYHASPIRGEYMQSLDLSSQLTLRNLSPMFEGTYSDVYKGNWLRQEVSAPFSYDSSVLNSF
jgi:hypothetical protein